MPTQQLSPRSWFMIALLAAGAMMALVISLALRQPWLGLSLRWNDSTRGAEVIAASGPAAAIAPGTVLVAAASGDRKETLVANDLVAEPASALASLRAYDVFLARQERLARLQASPALTFRDAQGIAHVLTPAPHRSITHLPVEFWVQLSVGLFAWLIAASVWIFRRDDTAARYLLLSGFSTLLFAPLAAVYSTRELALSMAQFRWLCDINFLGGCLYSATMVALLWYYPRRLGRLPFGPIALAAFALWWGAQELRLLDDMFLARRSLVLLSLLGTVALGVVQWRGTRRDPVARAALQWFLLAWLVGTSVFSALIFVPQVLGVRTDHLQGYAFLNFLLVYGGLAFGILRFRLFNLGEWWFRILLWVIGAAVFVALDLFLLLSLNLNSTVSLSLALLVCGFLWLPLRGWLWARLVEKPRPAKEALFRQVLDVSLSVSAAERLQRWRDLLQGLFDPLQVDAGADLAVPALADDGLRLRLPAAPRLPALALAYPDGGRRLFTPRDAALAGELLAMLRHADTSRDAYDRGVREERTRIARDLHDDIGARLLTGLQQDDLADARQSMQQAITDMRTIINGLTGSRLALDALLGELRHETALRLEAAGIALDWPLAGQPDDTTVDYRFYRHYLSMVREAISNILRHAGASRVSVAIARDGARLVTTIRDDGSGLSGEREGHGLGNLRRRALDLAGEVQVHGSDTGTCLRLVLSLGNDPQAGITPEQPA